MKTYVTISDQPLVARVQTKAITGETDETTDLKTLILIVYRAWLEHAEKPENEPLIKLA